jgi:hypothetical protein
MGRPIKGDHLEKYGLKDPPTTWGKHDSGAPGQAGTMPRRLLETRSFKKGAVSHGHLASHDVKQLAGCVPCHPGRGKQGMRNA